MPCVMKIHFGICAPAKKSFVYIDREYVYAWVEGQTKILNEPYPAFWRPRHALFGVFESVMKCEHHLLQKVFDLVIAGILDPNLPVVSFSPWDI